MVRRRAARVDLNQEEVVAELRRLGISVELLHQIGRGVPDLLLGFAGRNFLIELKSTKKGILTLDEENWHQSWNGQVETCVTVRQILGVMLYDRQMGNMFHDQFWKPLETYLLESHEEK